jgi:hypothetical protein
MRLQLRNSLWLALLFLPSTVIAQKKDSLRLNCLLENATEHTEKQSSYSGQRELKIILSSSTDTLVKAPIDVVISTLQRDEEGTWDVVFYHKDYWFWLSGLSKLTVRKDQKLKTGDTIGVLLPGQKAELLLYDFETPIDPGKYMNCGR